MRENKSDEKTIGEIDRKIFIDVFVSVDIGALAAAAISVVVAVVAIVSKPSQKVMMRSNIKANQYMCALLLFSANESYQCQNERRVYACVVQIHIFMLSVFFACITSQLRIDEK